MFLKYSKYMNVCNKHSWGLNVLSQMKRVSVSGCEGKFSGIFVLSKNCQINQLCFSGNCTVSDILA